MSARIETDVLIVGAGPAGLTAALFLSEYSVDNVLLEKYGWTAHTPRAHITNQRTMEIMRRAVAVSRYGQVVPLGEGTLHRLREARRVVDGVGRRNGNA